MTLSNSLTGAFGGARTKLEEARNLRSDRLGDISEAEWRQFQREKTIAFLRENPKVRHMIEKYFFGQGNFEVAQTCLKKEMSKE